MEGFSIMFIVLVGACALILGVVALAKLVPITQIVNPYYKFHPNLHPGYYTLSAFPRMVAVP